MYIGRLLVLRPGFQTSTAQITANQASRAALSYVYKSVDCVRIVAVKSYFEG